MKHWYNDGQVQKYCETCPEGFKAGRINTKKTEAELRNLSLVEAVLSRIEATELKDYYFNHTIADTLQHFNIENKSILKRALVAVDYDFKKQKPSPYKNKTSTRSHDSYVLAGRKSAKTQKQRWEQKTETEKENWCEKQKLAHSSIAFKTNISDINKNFWRTCSLETKQKILKNRSISNERAWEKNKESILKRAYLTRKQHKTFNSSKPEDDFYEKLITIFGQTDIIRWYNADTRYKHACDFYIKSLDLFIELNYSWTHGGHAFDTNNNDDNVKLASWREKAITSKYYAKAIDTWTRLDVDKLNDAKNNKLNYKAFYCETEANAFLNAFKN